MDRDTITALTIAVRVYRQLRAMGLMGMAEGKTPPRNLLRLAGVINSANREADDEAGALIERVRKNQRRTLGLIAKGHQNESLREQMLSEAEKEHALADLAAAVGDNGAPLDDEEGDKVREELKVAKSARTSDDSGKGKESATETAQEAASTNLAGEFRG